MAAKRVRLVLQPSDTMPVYDPSKPDPRIRALVRVLAESAARKFIAEERERASRDRLPE